VAEFRCKHSKDPGVDLQGVAKGRMETPGARRRRRRGRMRVKSSAVGTKIEAPMGWSVERECPYPLWEESGEGTVPSPHIFNF